MNKVRMNIIPLNSISLNFIGEVTRGGSSGGSKAPEGYDTFLALDGEFLAADGEFYVKL